MDYKKIGRITLTVIAMAMLYNNSVDASQKPKKEPYAAVSTIAQKETIDYKFLDVYDSAIEKGVSHFNKKLSPAVYLDPNLVKAIIFVESGGHKETAFKKDPMSIAHKGDPGLETLVNGNENSRLIGDFSKYHGITPAAWKRANKGKRQGFWDYSKSNITPEESIELGIAWLFHKAAVYASKTVEDSEVKEYVIKKGDNYSNIANKLGTTVAVLEKYNQEVNPKNLQIGQKIRYKEVHNQMCINEWRSWEEAVKRYNGGGDTDYFEKVMKAKEDLDISSIKVVAMR